MFISIHDGSLAKAKFTTFPRFNLAIPESVGTVPVELLDPVKAWPDKAAFEHESKKLAGMFSKAFERYAADCSPEGESPRFIFLRLKRKEN